MLDEHVSAALAKGAKAALFEWKQGGIPTEDEIEELEHDMWLWVLESPGTKSSMDSLGPAVATNMVKIAARQVLVKKALAADLFQGKNLYSSDAVREALEGKGSNKYLLDLLPRAMSALMSQNEDYAEAIRSRYEDGLVPVRGIPQVTLSRALKSLTEQINIIVIKSDSDAETGPGGSAGLNAVMPESRKDRGAGHPDPTGDLAVKLAEHGEELLTHRGEVEYLCETFVDDEGVMRALRNPRTQRVILSSNTTTLREVFES